MYAPLHLEFGEMVVSKMCLLPLGKGPVKEIPRDGMSHERAREKKFPVGTMVDRKNSLSPKVNVFENNYQFK